jgi:hypothetical protein
LQRLIRGTTLMSPLSSPLSLSLLSSPAPSSLVKPSSLSTPSSGPRRHLHRLLHRTTRCTRIFLSSGLPRSTHGRPPLLRRSRALPRTHRHRRLHLPVPRHGGTGGPHHRSGTHHPLTRPRSPTPLRPNAEEHMPHRWLWGQAPGTSPGWPQIRLRGWKNQRMKKPLQGKDE